MVLAPILGLSLSFIPCLLIGFIMLISFMLCNCEYIGETVARHFCAWKNRRKKTLKLDNNGKSNKSLKGGGTSNKSGQMREIEHLNRPMDDSSEYGVTIRRNIPGSGNEVMDGVQDSLYGGSELASAPSLSPSHSVSDLIDFGEDFGTNINDAEGSDPPPSYDECLREKYSKN